MTDPTDTMIPSSASAPDTANKLQLALAQLWLKNEGIFHQRILTIRALCGQLSVNDSGHGQLEKIRTDAHQAAHKLSGVLGTFGLPQGTELAREAEEMIDAPEPFTAERAARLESLLAELEIAIAAKSAEFKQP